MHLQFIIFNKIDDECRVEVSPDGRNKAVSTIMNEDSLRENNYAQMTLNYGCVEIQDEFGDYFMDEVGHAWKERFVTARNYDVAMYEARIDSTDQEVTSEGFYLDLMMTRGSDPAESKSTLGVDRVAGRHAVIAAEEE